MKNVLLVSLFVILILNQSCLTQKKPRIPPKVTESDNVAAKYFLANESPKEKTKQVMQPEKENIIEKKQTIGAIEPEATRPFTPPKVVAEKKIVKSVKKVPEKVMIQSAGKVFKLVSGSFRIKQNAERFVNKLKDMGYKLTYAEPSNNGYYRVITEEIYNESEARVLLKNFRAKYPAYNDAWLLYKK